MSPTSDDAGGGGHSPGKITVQDGSSAIKIKQYRGMEPVFNSLPQAMLIFGRDGIIRMNRAAVELHGFTPQKLSEDSPDSYDRVFEFEYPDGKGVAPEAWPARRALRGEVIKDVELRCRNRRTGDTWAGLYTAAPIADENGNIQSAVVVITQIAERKPTDVILERLASMVESSAVPMVGLTRDGIVESWNGAAEALFGYSSPEIVGKHIALLGTCEGRYEKVDTIRRVRSGGVVHNLETVRIAKDGHKIPVLLTIAPIKDRSGTVTGMSASVVDITRSKRAEDALKEADRRKDEFLAMLAHELRNPLAPIRNAVEIQKLVAPREQKLDQTRHIIERQVAHLARLIDDLLDVSRITQGKINLERKRVAVADVISGAVDIAHPFIDARQQRLRVATPRRKLFVNGDFTRLVQAIGNLLNNASKFSASGAEIVLRAEEDGDHVLVHVVDSGMGIAPEFLPHVFELFSQGKDTLDRSQGGLGIGLALVQRLVEAHGGTVNAKSDGPNKGSEFVVRLRLVGQSEDAMEGEGPDACGAKRRILVVDDNVDAAESLATLLTLQGHIVQTAHNALGALTLARSLRPHVVLLDIGLPGMDGYEVAIQLRRCPEASHATLIALSGYGQEQDRRRSKEVGFAHHLVKPVHPEILSRLIAA